MSVDVGALRFTQPGTMVHRDGMFAYTVLIRGPEDPDRAPRWSERDPATRGEREEKDARRRTKLDHKAARAVLRADIEAHPGTTYNAACVRCFGTTADVTSEAIEAALWSLVEDGTVVHTYEAPVRFILLSQTTECDDDRSASARP